MSRQIMRLATSIAGSKNSLGKILMLMVLGLPAWAPLTGVQAEGQTSGSVETKPQIQSPGRWRAITIDDQVKRFAQSMGLSQTQQSEVKQILEFKRVQIRRIRLDGSLSGEERIGRLRALQDSTVTWIRGLLNDEQKKKYDPLAARQAQKNSTPQPSVEEWMKAARKQP
jgi:hypothetical protein